MKILKPTPSRRATGSTKPTPRHGKSAPGWLPDDWHMMAALLGALAVASLALICSIETPGRCDLTEINDFTFEPKDKFCIGDTTTIVVDMTDGRLPLPVKKIRGIAQEAFEKGKRFDRLEFMALKRTGKLGSRQQGSPFIEIGEIYQPMSRKDFAEIHDLGRLPSCESVLDGDIPRRIPKSLHDNLIQVCRSEQHITSLLDKMVSDAKILCQEEPNSPLVQAFENIEIKYEGNTSEKNRHRKLIVISDMAQNEQWYSHYRLNHTDWRIDHYQKIREKREGILGSTPQIRVPNVTIYYIPSNITPDPRRQRAHREFWNSYFEEADLMNDQNWQVQPRWVRENTRCP